MSLKKLIKFSIIGFVGLMVIFVLIAATSSPSKKEQKTELPKEIKVGDTAIVNMHDDISDCSESVAIAVTKESQDKLSKASIAQDEIGILALLASGEIFSVPNCTKVKVIDMAVFLRQIRVLEGEQFGLSGWVPYEFVKAQ